MVCYLAFSLIAPLAALTARHVDVVFTATDPPFSTPGAYLSARLHRARLVIDERDVYPDAPLAVGVQPPKLLVRSLTKWFRWLRGQATSVITVSPGLKSVLIKRGASEDRTFVIPNYFPRSTRTLEPKRVDDEHRDVTVLYAGGLGRANDVSTCLEAAAIVNETGAGCVRFEFVGGGERLEEFVEWCSRKGHGRIAFLGAFPRGEMGPVYRRADIGISALPAHPYWRHALINKVFAYMEHGCPVVFAGEGDIESMLLESGAGLVVPPEDPTAMAEAILRLVRDKQLRQRMGMRGQSYMNTRFSYEQVSGLMQSALAAG
jgi:glycosyltransferase involved in cell wall biosynthesis